MVRTTRRNALKMLGAGAAIGVIGMPFVRSAQASGPYKIGFLGSLSGPAESLGAPMLEGVKIAVEDINAAGGINGRQIELVVRDDKAKPDVGTTAARELVGEGCNMLLGVVSSAVALAVSAVLQQEDAILITCAAHSMRLTKEDFNRNYFRITDNPYMRQRAQAHVMAEQFGEVTSWGGLIPDHEYGRSTWECFDNGLKTYYPELAKAEPRISKPIMTTYGGSDYRNFVASAMRDSAAGFFVSAYGGDAVTMYQQALPYGFFKKKQPIVDGANEFIVARAMKENFPEMWIGSHWYSGAFVGNPMNDELARKMTERTGGRFLDGFAGEGYSAVRAYAEALKAAGSGKTEDVIKALEGLTFDSPTGKRTIRAEDHQTIKPVVLYRVRGASNADGIEVVEHRVIDGATVIDPATPGVKLVF